MRKTVFFCMLLLPFLFCTTANALWYNVGQWEPLSNGGNTIEEDVVNHVPRYVHLDDTYNYVPICSDPRICKYRISVRDYVGGSLVAIWYASSGANGKLVNFSHINKFMKPGTNAEYMEKYVVYTPSHVIVPPQEGFKFSIGKIVGS